MKPPPTITIIGAGTGTFVTTQAIKDLGLDVTKIVVAFDSGGSTAKLRDEFGFFPVGDLRQSLAALAKDNGQDWIRQLLLYRFTKGSGLKGHNLGNLILTALQDLTGSTSDALAVASKIFRLKGQILPVTKESQAHLKIAYQDDTVLIGEHHLDDPRQGGKRIKKIELTKPCRLHPKARAAILSSDYIIIGPGDLYASLLPNFIVTGMKHSLKQTRAKFIYISNLMTRYTQTHNFTVKDHLRIIEAYSRVTMDYVLVNNGPITPKIRQKYAKSNEFPVKNDLKSDSIHQVIAGRFAASIEVKKQAGDSLPRSLMRHHRARLTKALKKIILPNS